MLGAFHRWDSESLLKLYLEESDARLLIGGGIEGARGFYSASIAGKQRCLRVGVITNQHLAPSLVFSSSREKCFIGHDQQVSIVNLSDEVGLFRSILLDGVFIEFVPIVAKGLTIALHELGCMALGQEGEVIWDYSSSDLLDDWEIDGEKLRVSEEGGASPVFLNVENGLPS